MAWKYLGMLGEIVRLGVMVDIDFLTSNKLIIQMFRFPQMTSDSKVDLFSVSNDRTLIQFGSDRFCYFYVGVAIELNLKDSYLFTEPPELALSVFINTDGD